MKFSHTILYVKDVEASTAFYEKAFGLTTRFVHEEKCYAETLIATQSPLLG